MSADMSADRPASLGAGMSAEVFLQAPDRVLKLYREPSEAAAIENEFRAAAQAHARGLPVARPIALLRRDGRTGILFERLDGVPMLRHYRRNPLGLVAGLRQLARIQQAIHAVPPPEGLPTLHERLRLEIGWARAPGPVKAAALAALDRLPEGRAFCHGDIHPGNALCTRGGLAIVDWQKACLGSPAADAARTWIMIRHGRLARGKIARPLSGKAVLGSAASWYGRCYRAASGTGGREMATEMVAWRLPLLVAKLCARTTDKDVEILAAIARLTRGAPETDAA